jgi:hypothetical protein
VNFYVWVGRFKVLLQLIQGIDLALDAEVVHDFDGSHFGRCIDQPETCKCGTEQD